MLTPVRFLNSSWKINLVLLLSSFLIYSYYFGDIFLHLNAVLSSNTLDSLKNYYTFVYHVRQDKEFLHFSGMNFPYGEHLVYTDCQPILTALLRLLPFTHPYLIGILHGLLFFSFIISPLFINKIFKILGLDRFTSFFLALGIALLAPQFVKINGGHYALAYGCIIPMAIYLLLSYVQQPRRKTLILIFLYNCFLFSLHPYLGFCGALFTFISLVTAAVLRRSELKFWATFLNAATSGLFPLLFFRLFMMLTDHHPDRPSEPFGSEVLIENIDSLLAPEFGPFQGLMEYLFPNRIVHYEGHSYLGFMTIVLTTLFIVLLPFSFRKMRPHKDIFGIFLASLVLLFLAFGLHNKLFSLLNIESLTFKQLRATSRFAWFFYYTLPFFVFPPLYHFFKTKLNAKRFQVVLSGASVLFLFVNLIEAHYFFKKDEASFWNCRNVFCEKYLNPEERQMVDKLHILQPQAIVPLPLFHGGSEFYDRLGFNNSMLPSMLYSSQSGVPILSSLMSRTSLRETENSLSLLNNYEGHRGVLENIGSGGFFILKTRDALLPDEERLLSKVNFFAHNDSLSFGFIDKVRFLSPQMDSLKITLDAGKNVLADSAGLVYIHQEDRKPFVSSAVEDYEHIYQLDSGKIQSGNYIVSLHYFYEQDTYRAIASDLIVTKTSLAGSEWFYILPLRYFSGYYRGYGVLERKIFLEKNYTYEFILKGNYKLHYRISDFMLRPEGKTVIIPEKNDSLINNFPTEND